LSHNRRLEKWAKENNMKIDIDKMVYQIFSLKHKIEEPDIKIKEQSIKRSNSTNYLGIILDNKLSLKQHTKKQIAKANNEANILKRLAGSKWGSNTATLNTTYRTYVQPILKYRGEIISTSSNQNKENIGRCQNKMLRIITGGENNSHSSTTSSNQHKLQTMQLHAKLAVNANKNRWIWEKENEESSLKTQRYFTTTAKDLLGKYNINGKIKGRLPPMNPLSYIQIPTIETLV
jgi:hypothetical protein